MSTSVASFSGRLAALATLMPTMIAVAIAVMSVVTSATPAIANEPMAADSVEA